MADNNASPRNSSDPNDALVVNNATDERACAAGEPRGKPRGKKKGTFTSRLAFWRPLVQAIFAFVWLNPWARIHTMCGPVFHCHACPWSTFACPIGVLAHLTALQTFPLIPLGVIVIFGALFGGFVCGWLCPFGFLQDLIARVPTPKFTLPIWAGYFRYVVLIGLVLAVPYWLGAESPWFVCRLCPAGALESAVPNVVGAIRSGAKEIPWPSAAKMIVLGAFVVAVFFVRRPWCIMFCPLGAIYGLFNRVSFFLLRFNNDKCVDCDNCRSMCQYGGRTEVRIPSAACNRCLGGAKCRAVSLGTVLDRPKSP